MFLNPSVMSDLHVARVSDLLAESAHDRLVRAIRRASTAEVDGVAVAVPARRGRRRIAPS